MRLVPAQAVAVGHVKRRANLMNRKPTADGAIEAAGKAAALRSGNNDTARETLESIVVAFVLAFLFRTFIAEAFVIPTGSMAPTLFGRHKDIVCPGCDYHYEIGASEELDEEGYYLQQRIRSATCPNCRRTSDVFSTPVFKGDRILVNKFPYEIGDPQRWDVCVFQFPEIPERNYIKRMVGLPGETIRLERGDVFARPHGQSEFQILRKEDPNKQDALQILVHDDAHPPRLLLQQGWPECWAAMQPISAASESSAPDGNATATTDFGTGWTPAPDAWTHDAVGRSFGATAHADWKWLRYRHYVPYQLDWDAAAEGLPLAVDGRRPQLITDYCGYNTFSLDAGESVQEDLFWVGDLTVEAQVELTNPGANAAVLLELVEGVRRYQCQIDVTTGTATLSHTDDLHPEGPRIEFAKATTAAKGAGRYRLKFANVDDRLCLWVNHQLTDFGSAASYKRSALPDPQPADVMPVGIAVRDSAARVSRLRIRRDIYYRADRVADFAQQPSKSGDGEDVNGFVRNQLREMLADPLEYARLYNEKCGATEFAELADDEFFVMGDNSPRSQDSRLWTNRRGAARRHAVPRQAMVGKAFAIYWPHGIPFMNNGQGYGLMQHRIRPNSDVENYPAVTVPFYPQFGRWLSRIR
jgi:signal peptidase I